MPKIHFIEHSGKEHVIEAAVGKSVMQNAVENLIPGIVGDCGGACSCATCHGYVDPSWENRVQPKQEGEEAMLDGALRVEPNSRLTCQITVTPELDGLVVRLPESQF
jgi:2Fe-2S ferredoxin